MANTPDDQKGATQFFLGRQPILDRGGNLYGYELLFRSSHENAASIADEQHATAQVIAKAFGELGITSVLGDRLGFLNLDTELLSCELVDLLPPRNLVLELLETTRFTPEAIECCRELRNKGFALALDDVIALNPEHRDILPYVSYVKVDVQDMPDASLEKLAGQLRGLGVTLLAEKVETFAQAEFCARLGFELFQGYYFAHPEILSGKTVDPSHQQMLRLTQLLGADAGDAEIENLFKQDPKLTYNLLRLVNSVAMGMRTRITSVRHAMMMLGRRQLQRWIALLLFAHRDGASFPNPLALMAAWRGRFMELLTIRAGDSPARAEQAYMTGMLSLLEAVLEIPMGRIVEELSMGAEIRQALLKREGRLGDYLTLVECVESVNTTCLDGKLAELSLTPEQLTQAEIEAMNWANEIGSETD